MLYDKKYAAVKINGKEYWEDVRIEGESGLWNGEGKDEKAMQEKAERREPFR